MRILRMQILLCAATEIEIASTIDLITSKNSHDIDILITGVGMVAATYNLAKTISIKKPRFILQAGVAGCLDERLPLTKIVVVENEMIGDLGVEENNSFTSVFDMNLVDKNVFPWKNGKLSNNISSLKQTGLTVVDGVTVNEISTNNNRISFYKNSLNALLSKQVLVELRGSTRVGKSGIFITVPFNYSAMETFSLF